MISYPFVCAKFGLIAQKSGYVTQLYHIWDRKSTHMDDLFFVKPCYHIYIWDCCTEGTMDVLRKINKMRLDRDWSVYRLSIESGISQSTLTNMFNRETLPSITTLECLCNAFGITMHEFFAEPTAVQEDAKEQELLALYRALSEEARQGLLLLLRDISKKNKNTLTP